MHRYSVLMTGPCRISDGDPMIAQVVGHANLPELPLPDQDINVLVERLHQRGNTFFQAVRSLVQISCIRHVKIA